MTNYVFLDRVDPSETFSSNNITTHCLTRGVTLSRPSCTGLMNDQHTTTGSMYSKDSESKE